jgi:LacI family transcriptional regulator
MKQATLKEMPKNLVFHHHRFESQRLHSVSLKLNLAISMAKELNYSPNSFAVNLRTQESRQ